MKGAIFIGDRQDACLFRKAGVEAFCPEPANLVERVQAERKRCRVLAMTARTFAALPSALARDLREGAYPRLLIITAPLDDAGHVTHIPLELRALAAENPLRLSA